MLHLFRHSWSCLYWHSSLKIENCITPYIICNYTSGSGYILSHNCILILRCFLSCFYIKTLLCIILSSFEHDNFLQTYDMWKWTVGKFFVVMSLPLFFFFFFPINSGHRENVCQQCKQFCSFASWKIAFTSRPFTALFMIVDASFIGVI